MGFGYSSLSRMRSGIRSARWRVSSSSEGKLSGPTTSGISIWWWKPSSSYWKELLRVKIGWPFWIAVTRRVLKLPPSRTRSTW
ncbi:hypothetical protein Q039_00347 [Pseudomonas aeruginosa BWHPSA026]|nr:hypothetical protein Q039_00347 [Pseudomonas aeruginosa BWHPSA026]